MTELKPTTPEGNAAQLSFKPVSPDRPDQVAFLTINRPQSANAFNGDVMKELTDHLKRLRETADCRAVVLSGRGKHFSAGADLAWMKDSAGLTYEQNRSDAETLTEMFEAFSNLPMPTVAVVKGAAYGGAVGLVACADVAVATTNARFCLSEVKVGLLPAVIVPYLARKMKTGQLRRHALSGRVFSATEALSFGLVEVACEPDELGDMLHGELTGFLDGAPAAQKRLKALLASVAAESNRQSSETTAAIADARTSETGQAGLQAFFAKERPPWKIALPEGWEPEL